MPTDDLQPHGERIRRAVRWICETLAEQPERERAAVLREAALRFDLTPRECQFVETRLREETS